MAGEWTHPCYQPGFHKHVETLTPSQRAFPLLLDAWLKSPRDAWFIVAGGPGTGKTYTVTGCLDHVDAPQLRMAYTARVACRMNGQTIHSALRLAWGKGTVLEDLYRKLETETDVQKCIDDAEVLLRTEFHHNYEPRIVVIDEIGMVPHWLVYWILRYFSGRRHPTLVVVMGDPDQLRPVKSTHNVFSTDLAATERIDLVDSKRFDAEYEPVVQRLRRYVDANDVEGMKAYICSTFPVVEHIDADVLSRCTRAMAHRNATVDTYNEYYLKNMMTGNRIRIWSGNLASYVDVKKGCRVFVVQNGVAVGAQNGTPLTFERHDWYDEDRDYLACLNDEGKEVRVNRNGKGDFPIVVGFAGTVHKFQGDTMDDAAIAVNFDGSDNLHLIYTALSRVRSMRQIVAIQLGDGEGRRVADVVQRDVVQPIAEWRQEEAPEKKRKAEEGEQASGKRAKTSGAKEVEEEDGGCAMDAYLEAVGGRREVQEKTKKRKGEGEQASRKRAKTAEAAKEVEGYGHTHEEDEK